MTRHVMREVLREGNPSPMNRDSSQFHLALQCPDCPNRLDGYGPGAIDFAKSMIERHIVEGESEDWRRSVYGPRDPLRVSDGPHIRDVEWHEFSSVNGVMLCGVFASMGHSSRSLTGYACKECQRLRNFWQPDKYGNWNWLRAV